MQAKRAFRISRYWPITDEMNWTTVIKGTDFNTSHGN